MGGLSPPLSLPGMHTDTHQVCLNPMLGWHKNISQKYNGLHGLPKFTRAY